MPLGHSCPKGGKLYLNIRGKRLRKIGMISSGKREATVLKLGIKVQYTAVISAT